MSFVFFFNDTATTEIYTLSLHDALPISDGDGDGRMARSIGGERTVIVERLGDGPIIRPDMDARMGDNVNGPSLVRAPSWVERPLGRYYLYFAHHDGRYIRLAYADDLLGPWTTYEPGVLPLDRSLFAAT